LLVVDLETVSILYGMAEKAAPGRFPSYAPAHVLKAIELISLGFNVGRQQLASSLGIGEGAARTIIRRLNGEGLIAIRRGGMTLTERGKELLNLLYNRISVMELPSTGLTVGRFDYAVLVRGSEDKISSGVEQRDVALLAGARGATTLVFRGKRFHLPRLEVEPSPVLAEKLIEGLNPDEGDVVIIGTGDRMLDAEIGSKSAALELLKIYNVL
jgi:DNA-binding transcriptional regulator LsrR (DeoR family)